MYKKGTIGIAITEHNRYHVFKKSYEQILKHAPKGAKIVVVDDASIVPVKEATYRFEVNAGIAKAKNMCLHLLDDCEHIFLFDSDTYPIHEDWHKPYIESKRKHLMYIFKDFPSGPQLNDSVIEYQDGEVIAYTHPRGCMLYFHNDCLNVAGGMRKEFGKWGIDHVELSERINNMGLTKHRFMDVVGSEKLIHSMDEHRECVTTVLSKERSIELAQSHEVYESVKGKKEWVNYHPEKNLILTCYFTTLVDPQRGTKWPYDISVLDALKNSVKTKTDADFFVIDDQQGYEPKHENPYLAKWIAFRDYLIEHTEYDNIFCVDGTDVEILSNPFPHLQPGTLYVGDENSTLNNQWVINNHPQYAKFCKYNYNKKLLNAGIIGGKRQVLMQFLNVMIEEIELATSDNLTDMATFNYVLRTYLTASIEHGRKVNTVFKSFDKAGLYRDGREIKTSWFKHK